MLHLAQKTLGVLALALTMLFSNSVEARQQPAAQIQTQDRPVIQRRIPEAARSGALPFVRRELFFGTARPDGVVTEQEFRQFVDDEVTKRFPDGLTLLKGDGQFRGEDNITIKEQSFVLILLYPYETFKKSSQKMASLVTVSWGAQRSGDPDHDELRSTPDDATARTASVRRGIPTTLSTPALDPVLMYDGRQQNLDAQAQAAILDHAAATRKPSATELERIAEFERTRPFFSSWDLWKLAVTPSATAGRC